LHDGNGNGNQTCEEEEEEEPAFSCVPWLPTPEETFYFYWRNFKKFEIRKSSDFGVLQSPEVRIARLLFIHKKIRQISILSF